MIVRPFVSRYRHCHWMEHSLDKQRRKFHSFRVFFLLVSPASMYIHISVCVCSMNFFSYLGKNPTWCIYYVSITTHTYQTRLATNCFYFILLLIIAIIIISFVVRETRICDEYVNEELERKCHTYIIIINYNHVCERMELNIYILWSNRNRDEQQKEHVQNLSTLIFICILKWVIRRNDTSMKNASQKLYSTSMNKLWTSVIFFSALCKITSNTIYNYWYIILSYDLHCWSAMRTQNSMASSGNYAMDEAYGKRFKFGLILGKFF